MKTGEITRLLHEWSQGDPAAANTVFPIVYETLRAMAHAQLWRRRGGGT